MASTKGIPDLSLHALYGCTGHAVVITGGSRGIGLMIAAAFVQNGATVYIFSRRPAEGIAEQLTQRGSGRCISMICDITDEKQLHLLVKKIKVLEPQGIHCLVNNSGTAWAEPFDTTSKHSFEKVLAVNVTGLFSVSQAFVPLLEACASRLKPSCIINIASIDGVHVPALEEYAYSASKSAVIHLTKVMAGFLAKRHITCNSISPGLFPSNMSKKVVGAMGESESLAQIPQRRMGRPQDIAGAVLFVSGPGGAYTTGANLVVDGGICVNPHAAL